MKRRRFTKRERWAAWIIQDGRSAQSGEPLGFEFHADHRDPWSLGGPTSIENCDALTPAENLAKGARMKNRFAWQDEFIELWLSFAEQNFFLCALPGAGKTRAARRVARLWIEQGGVVVIVGPTDPIKRNWRNEFQCDGLMLDADFYGLLRAGYHGIVTNYQAVKGQSLAFRKLCHDYPVLLICDEIHHASENELSAWGQDLREAFDLAKKRLLLSGTPVRSDRETTSFLTIESYRDEETGDTRHRYKMHYEYDWPRALEDGVIRTLIFPRVIMEEVNVEFRTKGRQTYSNDDDQYLTYALDNRQFLLSMLRQANDKLTELRKSDRTAAGLVVAKNIFHTRVIVELLETLGESPITVTSAEEEDSADVIDDFRDSNKRWLVSVRQVSEGVDVPRLRVLAYLTNYVTDLAFRQFVGRVARRREHETDDAAHGFVFIPECSNLVVMAEKIERMQELAFKQGGGGGGGGKGEFGITIDGTTPEFVGYVIHGRHFVGTQAEVIRQLMRAYRITEESASLMLNDPQFASGVKVGESAEPHEFGEPIWVQEKLLKDDCNELAGKLANLRIRNQGQVYTRELFGRVIAQVHAEFMIDNTEQKLLNVPQLQRKKEQLRRAIFGEG
jgi:superfamily II DNA or RNA helicase